MREQLRRHSAAGDNAAEDLKIQAAVLRTLRARLDAVHRRVRCVGGWGRGAVVGTIVAPLRFSSLVPDVAGESACCGVILSPALPRPLPLCRSVRSALESKHAWAFAELERERQRRESESHPDGEEAWSVEAWEKNAVWNLPEA